MDYGCVGLGVCGECSVQIMGCASIWNVLDLGPGGWGWGDTRPIIVRSS